MITIYLTRIITKKGENKYRIILTNGDERVIVYRSTQCSFSIVQIRKPLKDMGIDLDYDDVDIESNDEYGYGVTAKITVKKMD